MHEMLYPGVVGVFTWRHTEFQRTSLPQIFAAPIVIVRGWRRMKRTWSSKSAGSCRRYAGRGLASMPANGEVMIRASFQWCIGFLPVNRDVAHGSAVFFHEFFR